MTLIELRYIVALAKERHFGRAAISCSVSQPTLSFAIKKLEEELEIKIFERNATEVKATALGLTIIAQAQAILEQTAHLKEIAREGKNPLNGPLRLGVIYTIGPYLLPDLVQKMITLTPQMPLILQENFTVNLLEQLRLGEIDCAILAEPFPENNLASAPLYDEPFVAAVPSSHPLARKNTVNLLELVREKMLLLGVGHCFRDHVLQICPEFPMIENISNKFETSKVGLRQSFEGSSIETIKHMVSAGMGITLIPLLSVPRHLRQIPKSLEQGKLQKSKKNEENYSSMQDKFIKYLPIEAKKTILDTQERDLEQPPSRRVVLVWRRSFTRYEAIAALRNAVYACELFGVRRLT